jgi:hypothetical protein
MAHIVPHGVSDYSDLVIDEIVARCSEDMHGALKALLLINEHLEAELGCSGSGRNNIRAGQLRGPSAYRMRAARRTNVSLH